MMQWCFIGLSQIRLLLLFTATKTRGMNIQTHHATEQATRLYFPLQQGLETVGVIPCVPVEV